MEGLIQAKAIYTDYRSAHFYIIGATGTGKTKFLESLIIQDIVNNEGFAVIDPHGDLTENVKGWLYFKTQKDFQKEIVLIEPTDSEKTVSFNPLEPIPGISTSEIASELVEVFRKIWIDSWGERMADIMRNSLIALAENGLTLAELPMFLTDTAFRRRAMLNVQSPTCLERIKYFNSLPPSTWREWIESTLNKVDAFLSDARIRDIFSSPKSSFNLREIMDSGKILLVNLSRGRLKGGANLLGALLVSKIQMAAFSRADMSQTSRKQFYLYIDEFQNFATESFVEMLSEARKYKLALIMAHQNLSQLPRSLKDSILANCGMQTCFRVNREDAQLLAKELLSPLYQHRPGWEMNIQRLQELPPRTCFVANRMEGGIVYITTPEVPNPWEQIWSEEEGEWKCWDEETFRLLTHELGFGSAYLRDREAMEREYGERARRLMAGEEKESFKEKRIVQ
jgi:type IV secretory pathway TraG/TraD family ATPase VirD4